MEEIRPGVQHWKAWHPNIGMEVSSYYVDGSETLIDPMLPAEGAGWFRDHGTPRRIVLSNRHHYRDSDIYREEFGCPVLCHEAGLREFEGGPDVDGFKFGDRLAPEIVALEVGVLCPEETALHIALDEGLLLFGDALIRFDSGELGFWDDSCFDDPEKEKPRLREVFRGLGEQQQFDGLLFAHGDPLLGDGKQALRDFADAP